jgi:hypothetical protein
MYWMTEENLKSLSWDELHDLLDEKEKELEAALEEPIAYYSPGYSDTYHESIFQMNRHNGIKKDIDLIWNVINEISKHTRSEEP